MNNELMKLIKSVQPTGRMGNNNEPVWNAEKVYGLMVKAQQQVNSVDLADVVLSEERAELCQSFVVDTRTSSATKCANCQKEAWEHRHN
jgi:hypothetical protein